MNWKRIWAGVALIAGIFVLAFGGALLGGCGDTDITVVSAGRDVDDAANTTNPQPPAQPATQGAQ